MKKFIVRVDINKKHKNKVNYDCELTSVFGVLTFLELKNVQFNFLKTKKFIQLSYSLKPSIKNIKVVI